MADRAGPATDWEASVTLARRIREIEPFLAVEVAE